LGPQPQREAAILEAAGIAVRWAPPRFVFTHAKFVVLDDRIAVISTANFSRAAFTGNREFLLVDRNRVDVRSLSALFRDDWDQLPAIVHDPSLVISPHAARVQIQTLVAGARHTVDIDAEEVADAGMEKQFVRLRRRGVCIRILVPGPSSGTRFLWRRGIQVRALADPYMHAKVLMIDGTRAFVGSENLSTTSLDQNREVGMIVRGSIMKTLRRVFARDWRRAKPETR
jgi:cardiolipin synthase A/B